jgi:hypothetical protein
MTTSPDDRSPTLSPEELAAWRASPEYLGATDYGTDMEVPEYLQTLSVTERLERNDRFAALVNAARASQPVPSHEDDA